MDDFTNVATNQPLRVVFFTNELGGGGAEKHLQRIVNNFDQQVVDPFLVLVRPGGSYEKFLAPEVSVVYLDSGSIDSSTLRLVRSWWPLRKSVEQLNPDLVCSVMDPPNIVAISATRTLSEIIPTVACVQNNPAMNLGRSKHPVRQLTLLGMKGLYPQAEHILALSNGVRRALTDMIPTIKTRISVIHNAGIDEDLLEAAQEPLDRSRPSGPLLVACGSLTEQKGYPVLFEALGRLRESIDANLWILGKGKMRQQLEELARQLEIRDAITFLGFRDNPYRYMAAADAFVLSSYWEGFGNVVVEAMACDTPVVSTDCPHGPGEVIDDGESGLLVPPGDPEALCNALRKLLSTPELIRCLREKGKKRANDFHASTIASQYQKLFEKLVEKQ